jgi:hypothetical protein
LHEKIQSFVIFKPQEDGTLYASGFNVAPESRGYRIGEAMLKESLDHEARSGVLKGECVASLPISSKYIETGWVATRVWDDRGELILDILRDDTSRAAYWGKTHDQKTILHSEAPGVTVVSAATQSEIPFQAYLQDGIVLSRLFTDPETSRAYAVFEPSQVATSPRE